MRTLALIRINRNKYHGSQNLHTAETERGYQGLLPERVVYTRNLLRVYIAVVPVLQKSSPGQTHKMTHTITPPSHTMAHGKTHVFVCHCV